MSIEIHGDVTEEQFEHYCKNHTHVIINGNIITKAERERKEKEEQDRISKEKRKKKIANWTLAIVIVVVLVVLSSLPN